MKRELSVIVLWSLALAGCPDSQEVKKTPAPIEAKQPEVVSPAAPAERAAEPAAQAAEKPAAQGGGAAAEKPAAPADKPPEPAK